MTDPDSANQLQTAGSAIAAFQLAQFCFSALVRNGIVPKPDAERMLRQAVEANKTGGPGNPSRSPNADNRFAKRFRVSAANSPIGQPR